MPEFKLTNKAVEDLTKIWEYTFEVWSEKQADGYYNTIISCCQEIADNPKLGKTYEGVSESLFGMKTNRHIIFYRTVNENYIEIIRILHDRMDLKKRLDE
jgi:toxin ParE1/3/4